MLRTRCTKKFQGYGQIIMKRVFTILLMVLWGLSLSLYAEKVAVKKDGKQIGYIEYSYSEGDYIQKEGWGQEVKVSLYNDTEESVSVTIYLKGANDCSPKFEDLKPYGTANVSFWTEEQYRGIAITNVYVK